jgi:uncharacterized damage-inducible protein DinB
MAIVDALLPEYDHEMTTTRKLLDRIPEEKFGWKPHQKSMTMGGLGTHLATLPRWGDIALNQSEFDLAGGGTVAQAGSLKDLLATFDKNVAATRSILAGKSDAEMMAPWTLKRGNQTLLTMPKAAVMRSFVLNHIIHHRGQLAVYLRLNDVPVPSIYGPSADEGAF